MEVDKPVNAAPDSSEDNRDQPEQSGDAKTAPVTGNGSSEISNGEVTDSKQVDGEDNNISSSNGSATPKSGKAKGIFYFINYFYWVCTYTLAYSRATR